MTKHILLSMTVRHLTGSAELLTVLNRFGHCQSYTRILDVETAMCSSITENDSILPPNISLQNNSAIHFSWDNFDLNEETPAGTGTTYSTHGIIIQDVKDGASTQLLTTEMPIVQKDKRRTVKPNITELRPCFARPKVGPALEIVCSKPQMKVRNADLDNFIWLICRNIGLSLEVQTVPSWAGWASQTAGICDDVCSRVEYRPPINLN